MAALAEVMKYEFDKDGDTLSTCNLLQLLTQILKVHFR